MAPQTLRTRTFTSIPPIADASIAVRGSRESRWQLGARRCSHFSNTRERDTNRGPMMIVLNGAAREIQCATTVTQLLDPLGARVGAVAVEVNREVVPRSEHATRVLREGDRVEIVHFVGGG